MELTELAIVGSGPAGLSAAVEAAQNGVRVTVIDENAKPGGQLFKQIHKFFGSGEHQAGTRGFAIGCRLLRQCADLGVTVMLNTAVWGLFCDGEEDKKVLALKKENGAGGEIAAPKVVLATGAKENTLAFPGWTLPGVMGAGAAQTLANLHRILPGKKILMVGSGNVGLIVAYQLVQAGAEVVALIDVSPEIGGWAVHAGKIRRLGIPILTSHTIREAAGKGKVESAVIGRVDPHSRIIPGTERALEVDTVCLAVGLSPMTELACSLGCKLTYIAELGGHVPLHNRNMETTVAGVYVAGDVCGVEEASTAMEEGKIAGIAAAQSLGYLPPEQAGRQIDGIYRSLANLRGGAPGNARRTSTEEIVKQRHISHGRRGVISREGLAGLPGVPSREDLERKKGGLACIECAERIPCNPCETVCAQGAIAVGEDIAALPVLHAAKCTGCGQCVAACPGLAIFVIDCSYSEEEAAVSMPFEFLPLPVAGAKVCALNREGKQIGTARVIRVLKKKQFDQTAVVTVAVPRELCMEVRNIRIIPKSLAKED